MELQKYFIGFFILAAGVLCLLAGRFEHLRRRTFHPTKGICENVVQGKKIIRPCYQHFFRFMYNGIEHTGWTKMDYERLQFNKKYRILVNPMKTSEVMLEETISRMTRNEKFGWICVALGIIILLLITFL